MGGPTSAQAPWGWQPKYAELNLGAVKIRSRFGLVEVPLIID